MLSVDELLKPRYKVIADYPDNKNKVGDIITLQTAQTKAAHELVCGWYDKYPAIFQPLEWWQEREPDEMPEYLKDTRDGEIVKAIQYGDNQVLVKARVFECRIELRYMIPSCIADYNAYLQTTNQLKDGQ
jgi:hypothetical protein